MSAIKFMLKRFDPKIAPESMFTQYFEILERFHNETDPDDPLPSRELKRTYLLDPNPDYTLKLWLILSEEEDNKGACIGLIYFDSVSEQSPEYETSKHISWVSIKIEKAFRRQGIGTQVFQFLLTEAERKHCTVIQCEVRLSSGHQFCMKYGAIKALDNAQNRLYIKDIDWSLMHQWSKEGLERAPGVTLERFERIPEKDIDQYCEIYTLAENLEPRGLLEGEPKLTPKKRRMHEDRIIGKGNTWVTIISRELDGTISGLTEMAYYPKEPIFLHQWETGVSPKYRGKGLGKWIKAELLRYMVERVPQAKIVITGNADSNAPMLSINKRMGYKRYKSETEYKFTIKNLVRVPTKVIVDDLVLTENQ